MYVVGQDRVSWSTGFLCAPSALRADAWYAGEEDDGDHDMTICYVHICAEQGLSVDL